MTYVETNDVIPTIKQAKRDEAAAYKKALVDPWEIIDTMLTDMLDAAEDRGMDTEPIRNVLTASECAQYDMGIEQ